MIRVFNQYVSGKGVLLMLLEAVLISLAFVCGAWARFWKDPLEFENYILVPEFAMQCALAVIVFQVCLIYNNFYDMHASRHLSIQLISVGQALGSGCLVCGILYYLSPWLLIGRGVFFFSIALVATFIVLSRVALDKAWAVAGPQLNILILGTGELAQAVARELTRRDDLSIQVAGFFDPSTNGSGPDRLMGYAVASRDLQRVVSANGIDKIVVALEDRRGVMPVRDLVTLRVRGIRVEDALNTIALLSGRVWLRTVRPSWFVFSDGFHRSKSTLILKRIVDLTFGMLGLLVSAPIMLLVAVAVRLDSKGPIIYRQIRVGRGGRCFEVLKFRSMRADAEKGNNAQWAVENDPRVTRVGRSLRKFRFDELPQFINVIRGDMSFVGPRPERPQFVEQLRNEISYYDERHSVRPGLTGWAQVQYPYGASIEDAFRKLEYDLFYLKNMSVLFDCAIILKTIRTVFAGNGAR